MGKVPNGTLKDLVDKAKASDEFKFLDDSFNVSRQTVNARIQTGRHDVWHRGTPSPIIAVEPTLTAMITKAYELNAPLTVSQCKSAINELIKGTSIEAKIIAKRKKEMTYNPNKPLLGSRYWKKYVKRNEALVKRCFGKKFARNRAEHAYYLPLLKMYKRVFDVCVESGNAVRLEVPEHVDKDGNRVEDEADGYGYPAEIRFTNRKNIFVFDETGSNTGGRSDKNNGGEKLVCPTGVTPRQEVGIKDEHFTVIPITNLDGELKMVVIIFKGKELKES